MVTLYNVCLVLAVVVAVVFCALIFFTGKGDAMAGGSGVRTTFKGKASFDDQVSKLTLIVAATFMGMMLLLDVLGQRLPQ